MINIITDDGKFILIPKEEREVFEQLNYKLHTLDIDENYIWMQLKTKTINKY